MMPAAAGASSAQQAATKVPAMLAALHFLPGVAKSIVFYAAILFILGIAHAGLERRGIVDALGQTESKFLVPLFRIAETGFTRAEDLLAAYARRWHGSVDPVFREYAY